MAMLFMMTLRIQHIDTYPFLSCWDIKELLCGFIPLRNVTLDKFMLKLQHRHRKRKEAISHARSVEEQNQLKPY